MKPPVRTWTVAVLWLLAGPVLYGQELKERATFKGHTFDVNRIALSPDGKTLASGGGDSRNGELKLWDVATGKEVAALAGHSGSLYALAFSPDGKLLASADSWGKLVVWDVAARKERATFKGHRESIRAVAISPDGTKLASAGEKEVKLWDVASGKELARGTRTVWVESMAFSRDLRLLASPNYQDVDLWDVAAGKEHKVLSEQRGAVKCVAFSADGKTLVAASAFSRGELRYRGEVKLWDVAAGKERATVKGDFGHVWALALSLDGKSLALVEWKNFEEDQEVKLLDVATGRVRLTRKYPFRAFVSLTFGADGRLFVVNSPDGKTLKLWEAPPPKEGGK
jgi:tricorn protease-like protein